MCHVRHRAKPHLIGNLDSVIEIQVAASPRRHEDGRRLTMIGWFTKKHMKSIEMYWKIPSLWKINGKHQHYDKFHGKSMENHWLVQSNQMENHHHY